MIYLKHLIVGAGLLSLIAVSNSCTDSAAHIETETTSAETEAATETFKLQKEKLSTTIQLPGELIAFQAVDLYAKVSGFVKELKVDIGSEVRAGQILVTLEAPEVTSQLSAAESRLKSQEAVYTASEANYKRLLETSKTPGTISQNDLDIAAAKKASDFANLEAARASFREITEIRNYLVIRAPFAGVITARSVNPGAYVGPSGKGSEFPMLTLQQQKQLRLVVSIPEAYTGYISSNGEVNFRVRSLPSSVFTANMSRKARALDVKLRAERVEFDIDNSDGRLLPGTVADVSLPLTKEDSSFVIPKSALVTSSEGVFVVRISEGKVQRLPVEQGFQFNGRVEIFGDIQAGDELVLKGSDELKTGQSLKTKSKSGA